MNCPSCQRENPSDASFCSGCGQRLAVICASCGRSNAPDSSFCNGCGARLAVSEIPAPVPDRDPRSYTPNHLVDKILRSKSALEGERKQVTVLFADVKGSMELAEQVDPEEWHQILDRFFQILADGVHRFEGTVNQYTGDGIMALFGAPIAHEDHARRACYAALHLRQELRSYGEELKRSRGLNFAARMGLNSGEVVVGKIGDDLRMDYTAQGQVANLAERIEQLAPSESAYLTEHTARLVSGFFQLRDLREFQLKGVNEAVRVYELEGVGAMRTRLDASRARGFSKFVGRDEEMVQLEASLERALAGHGEVVGIVAEAGGGKSRLCHEFNERCRARDLAVREAHGVAHGQAVPLLPILELYRGAMDITEQDDESTARQKIAGRLVQYDRELIDDLPVFYDFLGVPDPQASEQTVPGPDRERRLRALLKRLTLARSEQRPAVLLFEDLHWFDAGSETFLETLIEAVDATRTLMVVNFRPEYRADWMGRSYYRQLALAPLSPEAIEELLQDVLGNDSSLAELPHRIRERTGGNPFFIEEIIQSLVESGALVGTRGHYWLSREVEALEIPATVQVVLAARIDRLAEREKQVLQMASVLGREFSESLLRRVADIGEEDLASALRMLVQAEFLLETALYPEMEYAFKHPLTCDVAYESQLREHRGRVHGAVARALSELPTEKLDESAALIAHHWEGAGEEMEAARWHRRAARWAGARDNAGALAHWRKIRDLLPHELDTSEALLLATEARTQIVIYGARGGLPQEEFRTCVKEGMELARRSGDVRSEALILVFQFVFTVFAGQSPAVAELEAGVAAAERSGDRSIRMVAYTYRPFAPASDYPKCRAYLEEAIALAEGDPLLGAELIGFSPLVLNYAYLSLVLANLGQMREAAHARDRGLRLLRKLDDPVAESYLRNYGSEAMLSFGDYPRAVAEAQRAVEVAENTTHPGLRRNALYSLANAHSLNAHWDEAIATIERYKQLEDELNVRSERGIMELVLARVHVGRGELDQALECADAYLAQSLSLDLQLGEARSRVTRARVLLQRQGPAARDTIESELDRAAELYDAISAQGLKPEINKVRAELARVLGDDATHDRELREAHRLYTEMGATGHAERLARELGVDG